MPVRKPIPQDMPADEIEKEPLEAAGAGETELTGDGTGAALPPIAAHAENATDLVAITGAAFVVRALRSFHDIDTKRDYSPGDTVPWDLERAAKYASRGFVEIVQDGLSK